MRIETKDKLYLHAHSFQPRFLVDDHDRPRNFFCEPPSDPADQRRSFPVVSFSRWFMHGDPDRFHERLHQLYPNQCHGEPNKQKRMNGQDGLYGDLIRTVVDCWDTPLIDVDAVELDENAPPQHRPLIVALVEYKRPGEQMRKFQQAVIANWRRMGGVYLIEER